MIHDKLISMLERDLPPVSLFFGPPGAGKAALAERLISLHQVHPADLLRCPAPLTIATARGVNDFLATAPLGVFKLVWIDLDGASEQAANALLKPLEEPPGQARFILTATKLPLPTIVGRSFVFRFAEPNPTTPASGATEATYSTVITLTRAIATGDLDLFDRVGQSFDQAARELLITLLTETATGRWSLFTPADTFGLQRDRARAQKMIFALHEFPLARPSLNVRSALEPFVA